MRRIIVLAMLTLAAAASADRLRKGDAIRDVPKESVEYALKDGWQRMPQVHMRAPEGGVYMVDEDKVAAAIEQHFWLMTPAEVEAWEAKERERFSRTLDDMGPSWGEENWVWIASGVAGLLVVLYSVLWIKELRRRHAARSSSPSSS